MFLEMNRSTGAYSCFRRGGGNYERGMDPSYPSTLKVLQCAEEVLDRDVPNGFQGRRAAGRWRFYPNVRRCEASKVNCSGCISFSTRSFGFPLPRFRGMFTGESIELSATHYTR